jgi:hypothetical protein
MPLINCQYESAIGRSAAAPSVFALPRPITLPRPIDRPAAWKEKNKMPEFGDGTT